jgi:hypothetical protein
MPLHPRAKRVAAMHVAELTLHAKPGHFDQVAEIYSEFATFNDRIAPLLANPSERVELRLLHHYAR